MADNYLEKKMEEHRLRSGATKLSRRSSSTFARPGKVALKISPLRILIYGVSDVITESIISRLRDANCKVAFICEDNRRGRDLAQRTGSRFYPATLGISAVREDIEREWGGIEVAVTTGDSKLDNLGISYIILVSESPQIVKYEHIRINAINSVGLTPSEVGDLALILCLDAANCLSGVSLGQH